MIGAVVGYLSLLDFGLSNTIVRFVAKYRAKQDVFGEENFLAHVFILYSIISLGVIIIGGIIYLNLESIYENTLSPDQLNKAKIMMLILIFNLALSLPGGAFTGICFGYEQFILPKITTIVRYLLRSILVITILYYGGGSISLVIIDTIMNIMLILANAFIALRILNVKIKMHLFDSMIFKTTLRFSFWIFVYAIVHQLRWQFGQFLIGIFYNTSIVAIYAVGITLGNYYGAFSGAIAGVFLPRATKMGVLNSGTEELTNMFIKISRILLFILLFIFGGFILFGRDFIHFWVGKEYDQAYYYVLIIMVGLTPILTQGFANNVLEGKNLISFRGKLLLLLTILGTVAGIFALKYYGVMQFIITTVVFMLLERIIMNFYYKKKADLDMGRYFKKVLPIYLSVSMLVLLIYTLSLLLMNLQIIQRIILTLSIYLIGFLMVFIKTSTDFEKREFRKVLAFIGINTKKENL